MSLRLVAASFGRCGLRLGAGGRRGRGANGSCARHAGAPVGWRRAYALLLARLPWSHASVTVAADQSPGGPCPHSPTAADAGAPPRLRP
eukprot:1273048-Pyramimonas_sp.AAC.1